MTAALSKPDVTADVAGRRTFAIIRFAIVRNRDADRCKQFRHAAVDVRQLGLARRDEPSWS